jgi:isopenicillin-N epimerase
VHPDFQESIYPLNVSLINVKGNDFADRFYWQGTYDPTAQLCVPAAIEALESIAGCGFHEIMQLNKSLNIRAAQNISEALHIPLPYPEDMLACMTSFPLPDPDVLTEDGVPDVLQEKLYHDYKIEIPVIQLGTTGQRLLRISCHIYNDISQYEYLGVALKNLL